MEINEVKYWVECSGNIEDFFEENNCVKIPSSISKNFVDGVKSFDDDGFHYNKVMFKYDDGDELIVKRVIYGLNDEKLFNHVYDKYKNLIRESILRLENEYKHEPIEKHYELYKHTMIMLMETQAYCRLFDLPTESLHAVKVAMDGIESYLKTEENISNEEKKVLKSLLWNGQDMLNTIVPFELHEITNQEFKNVNYPT